MILYEAIFIIELLLRNHEGNYDFLLDKSCIRSVIWLDLQLLEIQLPYFILEELYMLAELGGGEEYPDFFSLSCEFFDDSMFNEIPNQEDVKHFLDMRRCALLKTYPKAKSSGVNIGLPCALNLHELGVTFKCIEGESLLDIRFEKRKGRIPGLKDVELQIPNIEVDDNTEYLFRNLMALERCHYPSETHICNYIVVMDFLIDKEKDVELLVKEGIISNDLGENPAIAKMFNQLCLQIAVSDSCYYDIVEDLKAHHDNSWNHTKATLKRVHFSNLWRGTGTVAAIMLLLLTLTQTIFSICKLCEFRNYVVLVLKFVLILII